MDTAPQENFQTASLRIKIKCLEMMLSPSQKTAYDDILQREFAAYAKEQGWKTPPSPPMTNGPQGDVDTRFTAPFDSKNRR